MRLNYRFTLKDGRTLSFQAELDPETLAFVKKNGAEPPEWTRLENRQCPNCPLKAAQTPHCPVAVNMAPVIDAFKDSISYEEAETLIETDQRSYSKRTPLQHGIGGILGMIMVTSGCPILDRLRPMVRTHLPFATSSETKYRAMSMYLLAQYFIQKRGGKADWSLEGLAKTYDAINTVNQAFAKRLHTMKIQDASLNALVSLDCFGSVTLSAILDDFTQDVEKLFHAYF